MKLIPVLALASLFSLLSLTSIFANPVLAPSGLVGWWKGDGNTLDSVATNNGVNQNIAYTNGVAGQAFACDPENFPNGTYCGIDIPDQPAYVLTNSLTIEGWIRPRSNGGYVIFWRGDNRPGLDPYSIGSPGGGIFNFGITDSNGSGVSVGTLLPLNVWTHVAGTLDGSSGTMSFYTNGVLAAQTVTSIRPFGPLIAGDSPGIGIGNVNDGLNNFPFVGDIDEISLYNRALTMSEVQSIFNAGSAGKSLTAPVAAPSGLVSWWPAENNATDVISGNNGIVQNITYANGEVGQAFAFNGNNSSIKIPASASLNVGLGNGFTFEAWVNPATTNAGTLTLMEWNDGTGTLTGMGSHLELVNGSILGDVVDPANGNDHFLTSPGNTLVPNVFQHVAMTYDKTTGFMTLYRNGVAISNQNVGIITPSTSFDFYLGIRPAGVAAPLLFQGLLDEASLYSRVLSSNEIAAIYNAGSAGKFATNNAVGSTYGIPAITGFNPKVGSSGTVVTLSGTNFSSIAVSNIVHFGAVRATVATASPTNLTVTVPIGATFGPITVDVGGLVAYSSQFFEPTFAGSGTSLSTTNFASSFNLSTTNSPGCCVIADLDGDGKPDIALVCGDGHVLSIFRNISTNGALLSAASFAPRVDLFFPTNGTAGNPYRLRATDLDGDGKLDLIACEFGGNRVTIFHNITTPGTITTNSFEPAFALIAGNDCRFACAADLDGDGRVDIVALNYGDKTISLFKNLSTVGSLSAGSFAAPVTLAAPGGPYDAVIADLDGDGKPDLAVANADSGTVSIFQNASTLGVLAMNSFLPSFDALAVTSAETIAAVDLDGDGKLDLAVGSVQGDYVSVFRNVSSGGVLTTNSFAPGVNFGTPGWMHTIAVADFNGDGKPDLGVVGELPSYMAIFPNLATPGSFTNISFAPQLDFGTGWNAWGIAAGDLDGDGRPDIVFANDYDNTITIYQNQMPFGVPAICTPPPSGLVGWWPGEGNANDIIGTNNAILSAAGATYFPGKVGQGFRLDGTNGYVQVPYSTTLEPANVTIEAWVWLDPNVNSNTPANEAIIFKQNSWSYLFEGYNLLKASIDNGNGTHTDRFSAVIANSGSQVVINSLTVVQRGVWYHVAATYDGNQLTLYVNGVAEASAHAGFALDYGSEPVFFGTTGTPAPYTSMFAGIIDEPSIYNRAVASNEIAAIFNAGSSGKCQSLFAPVIGAQPVSQTNLASSTAIFSVSATGSSPLSYQWNFNGTNLDGATNSTLTLTNVQANQAGNYAVMVTNQFGSAVSSNASLTVFVPAIPPTILAQTPNQIVLLNNSATYSVTVNGSAPLSYFWSRNGTLIPGATNASYTLYNAQLSDSGSRFSCFVTNAFGSASSTNVSLKVIDSTVANDLCSGAIAITNASYTNIQSTVAATSFGDPVPDCVGGFGHGVWYQFTAPVAGLLIVDTFGSDFDTGLAIYTGSCDSMTEATCNDDTGGVTSQVILPTAAGATYFILAGGYASDAGNLVLHLNHLTPPAFVVQPTNTSVVVSSNASFSTTLAGTLPMTFQWYFNSVPLTDGGRISGSTNLTLNITGVITNDGGNYQLVASNLVGVTTSTVAVLTPVILPPALVQLPVSQSILMGSNANFYAVVAGTPPYNYQWYFNGNALVDDGVHIVGSATSSLNISNLTTADAGNYSLTVTNVSGSTNATAMLTVLVPPAVVTQPLGRSVPPGLPTTINATISGIPSPTYQWMFNGTNLPGANSSSYTIGAVSTNNLGFYRVVAQNSVGTATSGVAQLTFGPVAAWGRNLNNECLPPPGLSNVVGVAGSYQGSFAVRADGTIAAWGSSFVTNIPGSATNVVALFTDGNTGFAALRANGTITTWGTYNPPALSNVVSVALGFNADFVLRAEGTLVGWGNQPYSTVPSGLNHVKAVSAGYSHAVALRNDGTVAVWGSGAATNVPAGLNNVAAIAAGANFDLALKSNGTVVAWGSGTGTNLPSGLTNIVAISVSSYVQTPNLCLALRSNGAVVAWGDNPYGETNPPTALSNLLSVAIAAVPNHGLALVNDGSPVILQAPVGLTAYSGRNATLQAVVAGAQPLSYQWLLNGTNVSGATNTSLVISNVQFSNAGRYQLFVSNSVNTTLSQAVPLTVISNNNITFLSGPVESQTNYQGGKATFGVTVLGSGPLSYQWVNSTNNQIFTSIPGATNDTLVFDPVLANQSGYYYRCVVSNALASATSSYGFLRVLFAKAWGYLATDPPFTVTNATAIAVGNVGLGSIAGHYLVLKSDGKISSWSGSYVNYGETNVSALSNSIVTAIAAGNQDSLALKSDGTVYAWGYNYYGETNMPGGLSGITAIACGDYHDLALKSDGTVVGWGQNTFLQTTNAAATNVVAIAAGGANSVALRADGSIVTWGSYGSGQYPPPVNATNVIAVAAGATHFLGLRANGTVVGWGNNAYGQATIPASWSNIVAIAASGNHSVALRNDGSILTLGNYYNGPTLTTGLVPADLANVVAIASGGDHDLALFGTRAPVFTVQPWSRIVPVNTITSVTNITLAAKCSGVQPVRYQWQLNGTNLPGATNDTLNLGGRNLAGGPILIPPGPYQLIASNAYGVVASKYAKVTTFIPLGTGLNATNLAWTTSGNAPWYGETNITHDGVSAVQSGGIGALQETILQTTFGTNYAGSYTFWWKVSSEQDFDTLEFRLNGIVQTNISGEVDWQQVSIPVPAGTNVLQWRYSKDASFDAGSDAGWVDQFAFVVGAPVIMAQPQPAIQTVNLGATVALAVSASGVPQLKYLWQQNGTPVGGNSPTLVLSNVSRAQSGTYSVTVTNAGGSAVSSNAVVKVLVPQLLGTPTLMPDGSFQLTSTDVNGGLLSPSNLANFEAQASTDLVNWVTLPNALSLTNGMLLLSDPPQTNSPTRYYRILEH